MKLAILSDIHGNWPALEAVAADLISWQPDQIIINGDMVNRGPSSKQCWAFIAQQIEQSGWQIIQGNHEQYILYHLDPEEGEEHQMSLWTLNQMGRTAVKQLADLPQLLTINGQTAELRIRHASMHAITDGIWFDSPIEKIRAQIAPAPAVFATAHVHSPFIRTIDQCLIVNSGSVGTPADKDFRASYTQLEWANNKWHAKIKRVSYDRAQSKQNYIDSGFLQDSGPIGKLVYHEWALADYLIPHWRHQYRQAIDNNKITLEQSVTDFLHSYGLQTPLK